MGENNNWIDPKWGILLFVVFVLLAIGGYLFYANKKLIASGEYYRMEKKAKKKKENWYPD